MEKDYIIRQPIAKDLIVHPNLLLHQSKHEALHLHVTSSKNPYFYVIL